MTITIHITEGEPPVTVVLRRFNVPNDRVDAALLRLQSTVSDQMKAAGATLIKP